MLSLYFKSVIYWSVSRPTSKHWTPRLKVFGRRNDDYNRDEHKNRLLLFAMAPLEICATTIAELMPLLPEGVKPTEIAACVRALRGEVIE